MIKSWRSSDPWRLRLPWCTARSERWNRSSNHEQTLHGETLAVLYILLTHSKMNS